MGVEPGTVLDQQIVLERKLGRGGMGVVWLAKHRGLDIHVAVKILDTAEPLSEAARVRFDREARAMARIESAHVVRVTDVGRAPEGQPFIVMELLRGIDLKHRLEQYGPLGVAEAAVIIGQICDALERAHALGVIHRDLKPANVFLLEGSKTFVKLLDFGIAKLARDPALALTASEALVGTPYYMSPEQFVDPRTVDHRTDLWSVGVLAYAGLTGRLPFVRDTVGGLAMEVHEGKFVPPSALNPQLLPSLDEWFRRALQPQRELRFQSARELSMSFEEAARGRAPAPVVGSAALDPTSPPALLEVTQAPAKASVPDPQAKPRLRGWIAAGGLALVVVGSGAVAWRWFNHPTKPRPKPRASASTSVPSPPVPSTTAPSATVASAARPCDAGNIERCVALGKKYRDGDQVAKDEKIAASFFETACNGGDFSGCAELGFMYEAGLGLPKDPKRAFELYEKGCNGGATTGCSMLGMMYCEGTVVAKDPTRGAELLDKACNGGNMLGCSGLAKLYYEGDGVAKDQRRAAQLFEKACNGGSITGCTGLAVMYNLGAGGIAKDPKRAVELFDKACKGGSTVACNKLGVLYAGGTSVPRDDRRAAELFEKACNGDLMPACYNLGLASDSGRGVTKDHKRAIELYLKACKGGEMVACSKVSK